ncbi:uncharacterized protein EI90DRAFT_3036711 [Cantharellus anzutake]|uniref:uncharacterized protein n=1 Tax=Cantharellus anzutake TaxID=1750568 RepID=UPI0019071890|nr:uncharacterized protein EI90DRAFT_3036711 [Cantharellus anzutake]KAF8340739.1 hypothetical protein EI90DRAFT_3036711 [Cantharellus anzutake]
MAHHRTVGPPLVPDTRIFCSLATLPEPPPATIVVLQRPRRTIATPSSSSSQRCFYWSNDSQNRSPSEHRDGQVL